MARRDFRIRRIQTHSMRSDPGGKACSDEPGRTRGVPLLEASRFVGAARPLSTRRSSPCGRCN